MKFVQNDTIDVAYVAELARLKLSSDEIQRFQKQLGDIIHHVDQLKTLNLSGVPDVPIDPTLPTNALRDDVIRDSFTAKEVLNNAPARTNDLVLTPKIVE